MVYSTPELRLVGAAHTFVLGIHPSKTEERYEEESDLLFSNEVEKPW